MGKKKKKSSEEIWIDEMKDQEKTIYEKEHTFSDKELKIAKRFMDKKHKVEDEAVSLEDEKIFDAKKMKDFDPEELKKAKTISLPDEGTEEVVYAPEPKQEKYVHLADEKDYIKKIEIDTHEGKPAPAVKKPPKGKAQPAKGKKTKKK